MIENSRGKPLTGNNVCVGVFAGKVVSNIAPTGTVDTVAIY